MSEPGAARRGAADGGHDAPGIQRILDEALEAADWFGSAHQAAVLEASGKPDVDDRMTAVRTLIVEETRVAMLIGVAVGYELAHELMRPGGLTYMDIRFLGHSAFELTDGDTRILIDPFISGNPKAAVSADELEPTHILLTHGHADHYGDTVDIAKRTGAPVLAIVEIADELAEQGVEDVHDPNLGGTVTFDWGWVKLVPAWHTSTTPNGTVSTPGRAARHGRRQARLPPRRHVPVLRPAARRAARRPRRRRARADRRPLHDGPPRRRDRVRVHRRRRR